mmetsp:Transcript_63245/g.181401  ORF Transcript_63245/g.181401 Transcript_63245/m.181401 type:complete len:203 (-) Transcript_63245:670-1278(-)
MRSVARRPPCRVPAMPDASSARQSADVAAAGAAGPAAAAASAPAADEPTAEPAGDVSCDIPTRRVRDNTATTSASAPSARTVAAVDPVTLCAPPAAVAPAPSLPGKWPRRLRPKAPGAHLRRHHFRRRPAEGAPAPRGGSAWDLSLEAAHQQHFGGADPRFSPTHLQTGPGCRNIEQAPRTGVAPDSPSCCAAATAGPAPGA